MMLLHCPFIPHPLTPTADPVRLRRGCMPDQGEGRERGRKDAMLVKQSAVSHSPSVLLRTGIKRRACKWDVSTCLGLVDSLRIWPSSLARKGRVSSVAASFPTIKCWLASTTAGGCTRRILTPNLSNTHTPPAVNTSWKKAFTFASMSERKLKHNDSSLMCKMWYESLPRLRILACTRACSLFTHSRRVYIYKCTGTWPRVDTLQHTCTSFLLAWKNSCALLKTSADTCSGGCQNIVLSCKTISQDELPRVQSTVNGVHWQRLYNPRKTCLLLVCYFSLLEE